MRERTNGLDLDKLSTFGQDALVLLVFVVGETLAVSELVYHSLLAVSK
jgi:hypothetical protein